MHWFKIVLLVIFGLEVLVQIAKSGGWEYKGTSWGYAINAVCNTLLFAGIWLWL